MTHATDELTAVIIAARIADDQTPEEWATGIMARTVARTAEAGYRAAVLADDPDAIVAAEFPLFQAGYDRMDIDLLADRIYAEADR